MLSNKMYKQLSPTMQCEKVTVWSCIKMRPSDKLIWRTHSPDLAGIAHLHCFSPVKSGKVRWMFAKWNLVDLASSIGQVIREDFPHK